MTPLFNFVFLVACALLIDNSATVEYTRLVFEKCIELKMNNSNWNGIIVILISNSTWVNPVKKIDHFLIAAPELKWPNTKRMNQFSLVQTLKSWKCDWDWEPAIYIGYDNEIKMEMPNYWYRCARCHSQKEPLHSHFDDFFCCFDVKAEKISLLLQLYDANNEISPNFLELYMRTVSTVEFVCELRFVISKNLDAIIGNFHSV